MQEPRHLDRLSAIMYSGETIAGIVFGVLVIVLIVFLFVTFAIMRLKERSSASSSSSFLRQSSCLAKCLLANDGSSGHQHHDDPYSDQQAADRLAGKKVVRIIENPGATTHDGPTDLGHRANGCLANGGSNSKYGSFSVISNLTMGGGHQEPHQTGSSGAGGCGSQQRVLDTDSGHEDGSYESRVSIVTSGRSGGEGSLLNAFVSPRDGDAAADDVGCSSSGSSSARVNGIRVCVPNDLASSGSRSRQHEELHSLRRPEVRGPGVHGKKRRREGGKEARVEGTDKGETERKTGCETHSLFAFELCCGCASL